MKCQHEYKSPALQTDAEDCVYCLRQMVDEAEEREVAMADLAKACDGLTAERDRLKLQVRALHDALEWCARSLQAIGQSKGLVADHGDALDTALGMLCGCTVGSHFRDCKYGFAVKQDDAARKAWNDRTFDPKDTEKRVEEPQLECPHGNYHQKGPCAICDQDKRNREGDGHICVAAEVAPCPVCGRRVGLSSQ